jgi:hypothetical protein
MKTSLCLLATPLLVAACNSEGNAFTPIDSDSASSMPMPGAPGNTMPGSAGAASMPSGSEPGMQPSAPSDPQPGSQEPGTLPEPPEPAPPFGGNADLFAWSTEEFSLDAGQERYLCFASTLAENLVVSGYHVAGQPFAHHLIFSRARAPEPEGFAECDIAFRNTWETLFIAGTGDTMLEFPADAGHQLTAGTQLVAQLHLLNASDAPVSGSVTIDMRRSSVANPRPVSSFIFGTAAVQLPPGQTTEVVGTCPMWQPVQLIAGFPHMHLLGTSLTFEVGTSAGPMREVFKRDPFSFDDQRIEMLDVSIAAGDVSRVRCTFDNTLDEAVDYGESTRNEMCYFVGFAVDRPSMSACLEVLPPNIFGN